MISYPFTQELFKNVLAISSAIQGRIFMCPNYGREMNSDELGQVILDVFNNPGLIKKYPLVLRMPPVSYGYYIDKNGEWEKNRESLFFLKTTYYTGDNKIAAPNAATNTSTHTIMQDWHDMKRCATNFVRVLDKVSRTKQLVKDKFRLDQEYERVIVPISNISIDRASGVRLDLRYSTMIGCELEDYAEEDISTVQIPSDDSHPEHAM